MKIEDKPIIPIYSIRVEKILEDNGFEPFFVGANPKFPQYIMWKHKSTPQILELLRSIE